MATALAVAKTMNPPIMMAGRTLTEIIFCPLKNRTAHGPIVPNVKASQKTENPAMTAR